LVKRCNALGVLVDTAHLNEAGFRDVAALSDAPVVATHSNVHALSAASRNLLDWQMRAIGESGGVMGLNYAVSFLREDGRRISDTPLEVLIRHLDAMIETMGEGCVALGSDFDGALIPRAIGDAAGLPALVQAMRDAGYGEALVDRICWGNWVDVLRRTIG
jgi:membrane dipeptidase